MGGAPCPCPKGLARPWRSVLKDARRAEPALQRTDNAAVAASRYAGDAVTKLAKRLAALNTYPMAEMPAIKKRPIEQGVDVIDVGAGDADFPPPPVAVEALARAVQDPAMSRYAFQLGLPAFREAAADYLRRRFGLTIDPFTELHPLLGSKEGIAHLAAAVLDPDDVAIVPVPGYAVYHGGTVLADAEPYLYDLTPRTDFLLELEEIPASVLKRAKLVYLNYPNNPTAAVASREYLERM